jgi:hypothetical protein
LPDGVYLQRRHGGATFECVLRRLRRPIYRPVLRSVHRWIFLHREYRGSAVPRRHLQQWRQRVYVCCVLSLVHRGQIWANCRSRTRKYGTDLLRSVRRRLCMWGGLHTRNASGLHLQRWLCIHIHDDNRVCGQHEHMRCLWLRLQLRRGWRPAGGVFVLCWLRLDGANLCCLRLDYVHLHHNRLRRRECVRWRLCAASFLRRGLLLRCGQYRSVQRAVHRVRWRRHMSRGHRVRRVNSDVHGRVPHRVLLPRLERPHCVHDVRRWFDLWRGAGCERVRHDVSCGLLLSVE